MVQAATDEGRVLISDLRLLIVEDDERDLATFRGTTERYEDEKTKSIDLVECKSLAEAKSKVDNTFDGAIIDLKLGMEGGEGNQVASQINKEKFPIPIAILTGTPEVVDPTIPYVGVFTKGEPDAAFDKLLDLFGEICQTGVTRILGGRGTIQAMLGSVFWSSLMPQIDSWKTYAETNPDGTEKALLRHTLSHLIQLIDEDVEDCFPEEFYLHPPPNADVRTGSILRERETDNRFVVMSPSCDLVFRQDGKRKTDRILVAEVVAPRKIFAWHDGSDIDSFSKGRQNDLRRVLRNSVHFYYHCLPKTDFSPLGFIDFRRLHSMSECEMNSRFQLPPWSQMSPSFTKDLVSRFSSYYARQGQPDIDFG